MSADVARYEDVLVVRVKDLVPEELWRSRYDSINDFERILVREGTTILKFFLHISPERQLEKFRERLELPEKHWKFSANDIKERRSWDAYRRRNGRRGTSSWRIGAGIATSSSPASSSACSRRWTRAIRSPTRPPSRVHARRSTPRAAL